MNQTPDNTTPHAVTVSARSQYHPAVQTILDRHLGPGAHKTDLRDAATVGPAGALADLLYDAASDAQFAVGRLDDCLRRATTDYQAARDQLAHGGHVEPRIGGYHDLTALAARYTQALCHLEAAARVYTAVRDQARGAALAPPAQVLSRPITRADVRRWPEYFIGGPGTDLARDTWCPHAYRLTDSCPGCDTDDTEPSDA